MGCTAGVSAVGSGGGGEQRGGDIMVVNLGWQRHALICRRRAAPQRIGRFPKGDDAAALGS